MRMGNFRNRLLKSVSEEDQSSWRGVFIEDTTGKLWKTDDWDGSATFNSVAVITDTHSFGVAGSHTERCNLGPMTRSMNVLYGKQLGRTGYASESAAIADMDGEGNTANMLSAQGTGSTYAVQKCNAYTFPNGKNGYLMAAGELMMIEDYVDSINEAMTKVGGEKVYVSGFSSSKLGIWTSTYCTYCEGYDSSNGANYFQLYSGTYAIGRIALDRSVYSMTSGENLDYQLYSGESQGSCVCGSYSDSESNESFGWADRFESITYIGCRPLCRLMKF